MSEQQNYNRYEDEIDLKELFMVLWKAKVKIVCITLVFAIVTALFTMFLIKPTYEAKLDLIINMPVSVSTKYGEYPLMMSSNDQYVNMIKSNDILQMTMKDMNYDTDEVSVEGFSERILITKDEKQPNSFKITVKANSAEEALQMANNLFKNYVSFLNTNIKTRSANYFINYYETELFRDNVSLEMNEKSLKQNNDLLAKTPQTINQKEALGSVNIDSIDYVVLENILNENYKKIELDIITIEQTINVLQNKTYQNEEYIKELEIIKASDTDAGVDQNLCKFLETSVSMPSRPVAPSHKSSPSTMLNTVIGAVVGGMIAVIYVLVKKYWFTEVK